MLYADELPWIFQAVNFVLCADDTNILGVDREGGERLQHKMTFVMQQSEL